MDKIEIYHYLKRKNIAYEITEHKAVFNMEEADSGALKIYLFATIKNVIII